MKKILVKKLIYITIICLVVLPIIISMLFPSNKSGIKYGYIDKTGKVIIKPQFIKAGDFHEGLAYACKTRCGYIDKTGKFVIKPRFQDANDFSEGLASVRKFWMYGFIDKTGKFVIKPKFLFATHFSEGLANVAWVENFTIKGISTKSVSIKSGYVDKLGHIVIKLPQNATINSDFKNGLAVFCNNKDDLPSFKKSDRYGFIDKTGKVVIPPKFKDLGDFSENIATVKLNNKWGVIDTTGKFVIQPRYNNSIDFYEGLADVKIGSKYGYMNKNEKIVIKPQFDIAGRFEEGLAPIVINNKQGYINKKGEIVIKPQFTRHHIPNYPGFREGLAAVNINNKIGFISKNSDFFMITRYDETTHFSEGLVKVGIKIRR